MTAAGYVRVSTKQQAKYGVSLDVQEAAVLQCAVQRGYSVEMFSDRGVSGKSRSIRPGVQAAIAYACKRGCPLIVYDISRLGRNLRETLDIADELSKHGAGLISCTENIIDTTSAQGNLIFQVLGVVAEFMRRQSREKILAAIDKKIADGGWSGGIPYGYVLAEGDKVDYEPTEQKWVQQMRAWKAQGWGVDRIAAALNEAGVPTKRGGKRWYGGVVARVLRNRRRKREKAVA